MYAVLLWFCPFNRRHVDVVILFILCNGGGYAGGGGKGTTASLGLRHDCLSNFLGSGIEVQLHSIRPRECKQDVLWFVFRYRSDIAGFPLLYRGLYNTLSEKVPRM
jgi:hypothetical protein